MGTSSEVPLFDRPLRFTGNNKFVYGGQCFFGSTVADSVAGLTRYSNGFLNYNQAQIPTIAPKNTADVYSRGPVAADTTNHVAMSMIPINVNADQQDGLPRLLISPPTAMGTSRRQALMPTWQQPRLVFSI